MQLELFAEAGAVVAAWAVMAGAGREVVAGILRRAAAQTGSLPDAMVLSGEPPS
jgi:hypothetical protein